MRKSITMFAIGALMLTATTAFAHDGENREKGRAETEIKAEGRGFGLFSKLDGKVRMDDDHFILNGTVTAIGAASLTINTADGSKVVTVDTDTKYSAKGKISLVDIKVGDQVVVKGKIEDGAMEADRVMLVLPKPVVFGTVTAKTDTSVTVKNNITGTEKVVTINPDTKVAINGEIKTAADIQVGDKGIVKFKTVLDTFVATMIRLFR